VTPPDLKVALTDVVNIAGILFVQQFVNEYEEEESAAGGTLGEAVGDRMEWGMVVVEGESRVTVAKEAAE
jgi:hypothetical protein